MKQLVRIFLVDSSSPSLLVVALPFTPGPSLLVGMDVGEAVHVLGGREDAVSLGEDVAHGEGDVLAAAPKCLAEQMVGAEGVGEGDLEAAASRADLRDVEHRRRARWEVREAGPKEESGELGRSPPPRDGPAPQGVLHEPARWVLLLVDDSGTAERRAVELHGGLRRRGATAAEMCFGEEARARGKKAMGCGVRDRVDLGAVL